MIWIQMWAGAFGVFVLLRITAATGDAGREKTSLLCLVTTMVFLVVTVCSVYFTADLGAVSEQCTPVETTNDRWDCKKTSGRPEWMPP